jgi:hypothetical protein
MIETIAINKTLFMFCYYALFRMGKGDRNLTLWNAIPERVLVDKKAFWLMGQLVREEITLDSVEADELREYIQAKGALLLRNAEYKQKHFSED